jgi:hypothetical protein
LAGKAGESLMRLSHAGVQLPLAPLLSTEQVSCSVMQAIDENGYLSLRADLLLDRV